MTKKKRSITGLLALAALAMSSPSMAAEFEVLDTSAMGSYPEARSLSANGKYMAFAGDGKAWVWEASQPSPIQLTVSEAYEIPRHVTDTGVVVGLEYSDISYAVVWDESQAKTRLPVPAGFQDSEVWGGTPDGSVLVGTGFTGTDWQVLRWVDGQVEGFDVNPASNWDFFIDVSDAGNVVVGNSDFNGDSYDEVFLWTPSGGAEQIAASHASTSQQPEAISGDGSTVVGSMLLTDSFRAFRWTRSGGFENLSGQYPGTAYDVSADGSVVVGESYSVDLNTDRAFIWTRTKGFQWLDEYLMTEHQIDVYPYTLMEARGISNDGATIIGYGLDDNYNGITWRVELGASPEQDTDGDGMPDDWEISNGLDPYNPDDAAYDFDGDGLANRDEFNTGTDPNNPDTDGDGIPDGDDSTPTGGTGSTDTDGDGLPDEWEEEHYLDPTDPNTPFEDPDQDWLTNGQEYDFGSNPNSPDTDLDGLSDFDEWNIGTDPNAADSDADTMPDGWEVEHGLDPLLYLDGDRDPDGDQLTNAGEYQAGTDPHEGDTDQDGLLDGYEVQKGLDPLKSDTDDDGLPDPWEDYFGFDGTFAQDADYDLEGDGLTNLEEFAAGTDPTNPDTDGDGITDGTEVNNGTSPVRADTDQDGLSDSDELAQGLDPTSIDTDGDGVIDGLQYGSIVQVNVAGNTGNAGAIDYTGLSMSQDGRYVVFISRTVGVVPQATVVGEPQVYVRDVQTGEVELVSVNNDGVIADDFAYVQHGTPISADGRYVVFQSSASNLVPGVSGQQIYLRDRELGETRVLASHNESSGGNYAPSISPDGQYVSFRSSVPALTGYSGQGDDEQIVRLELATGNTQVASIAFDGNLADYRSTYATVSNGGRYVAFSTSATNLIVGGDSNNVDDVYVRDFVDGVTFRASEGFHGTEADRRSGYGARFSNDLSVMVFSSDATNLVDGDTNWRSDVFLREMKNGKLSRVSVSSSGAEGEGYSTMPAISGNGEVVAFRSTSGSFYGSSDTYTSQVYAHNRSTGETVLVSRSNDGTAGDMDSGREGIGVTADGTLAVFGSSAANLVPNDEPGDRDAYVAKTGFTPDSGNGGGKGRNK